MQSKWFIAGIETPTPPPGSGTGAKSAKIVNCHGPTALLRPTAKDPRPDSVKAHPQEPIGGMKPEAARALPPQVDQLMSQGDKLEFERRSGAKPEREHGNESR